MSLSAIVLAGGQSFRMGTDKALLQIEGVPLLRQVCDVALTCTPTVYVVTPWPHRYRPLLPASCHLIQETYLLDDPDLQGPLVGFAQGLAQVQTDWVLLLACDLPCLRAETLQAWSQALPNVPEAAIAYLPRQRNRWEPLCGFYRKHCLTGLNEFIQEGGRSFQRWLDRYPVEQIPLGDPQILFNCNTPQDLDSLNQSTN